MKKALSLLLPVIALVGFSSIFIFFVKQKTAYELRLSLVGSEMCIRDSAKASHLYPAVQLEPGF